MEIRTDEIKADISFFRECITEIKKSKTAELGIGAFYISEGVCERAISVLEKQVPKKPDRKIVKGLYSYECPECGKWVTGIHEFCFKCGQRIDWK